MFLLWLKLGMKVTCHSALSEKKSERVWKSEKMRKKRLVIKLVVILDYKFTQ